MLYHKHPLYLLRFLFMGRIDYQKVIGFKVGKIEVIGFSGYDKNRNSIMSIKCECGMIKTAQWCLIKHGHYRSCGCDRNKTIGKKIWKHGLSHQKIYNIWNGMKDRCDNINNKRYKSYGGRGIAYDSKWGSFIGFYKDMGDAYVNGLTIDRIDVNGNYCKENCRRVTMDEQRDNKTTSIYINVDGVKKTIRQVIGNNVKLYKKIYYRIKKGQNIDDLLLIR